MAFQVVCSAKCIVQGIPEYSPICEIFKVVVKPLSGCPSEIEDNIGQVHLLILMIVTSYVFIVFKPIALRHYGSHLRRCMDFWSTGWSRSGLEPWAAEMD